MSLRRDDLNEIPENVIEIRLFSVIRDEFKRLPYFIDFYRKAGVERLFFVDNGSTDSSREFLLDQPDTHVFFTDESYVKGQYGHEWLISLLELYGRGGWCVAVDADEFIRYPFDQYVKLPDLCRYLDSQKSEALYTYVLDMYSDKPISHTYCANGEDPLQTCCYFDTDTHYLKAIFPSPNADCMLKSIHGGMRRRVFGIEPCLSKYNLFLYKPDTELRTGCHFISNNKISRLEGVTLHFKYTSDFCKLVNLEADNEKYGIRSADYMAYMNLLREKPDLNLSHPNSARWVSPEQLIEFDMAKYSDDFCEYADRVRGVK